MLEHCRNKFADPPTLAVLELANGRSKGCGLVEYSTEEEAALAISELNNTELEGRLIFVREDREPEGGSISKFVKRASAPPRVNGDGRQLYVGNVSLRPFAFQEQLCRSN